MDNPDKATFWGRLYSGLRHYLEAMGYDTYDQIERQDKQIKRLENEVTLLREKLPKLVQVKILLVKTECRDGKEKF